MKVIIFTFKPFKYQCPIWTKAPSVVYSPIHSCFKQKSNAKYTLHKRATGLQRFFICADTAFDTGYQLPT